MFKKRKSHAVVNATVCKSEWQRIMSMFHNKPVQCASIVIQLIFFDMFSGMCRAFLRVASKDPHHTREATSTARSIRTLSVHNIASIAMKLNTVSNTGRTRRRRTTTVLPHGKFTWRNEHLSAIDGGGRIRLLT